jgi:DNA (cytosine-5)-methyltransferase 1
MKRKHIEFFAGCGGMALGLESAGFELEFANEVSSMAAYTFSYNILNADIKKERTDKVKWIHSRHPAKEYEKRISENLLSHGSMENSEIAHYKELSELKGKMLIGDIIELKQILQSYNLLNPYNFNMDLISGGPPCQSFSIVGKREQDNYKNQLPLYFAEVCELLKPKIVLMENVKGILLPFKQGEKKYYAWFEIAKVFAQKGYIPLCMLINSKYFGVAQSRPRYIMIAFREDIFNKIEEHFKNLLLRNKIIIPLRSFFMKIKNGEEVIIDDLDYFDIEKENNLFNGELLPKATTFDSCSWISVKTAIGDLEFNTDKKSSSKKSNYVIELNSFFISRFRKNESLQNHTIRNHNETTRNRFLLLQLLNFSPKSKKELLNILKKDKLSKKDQSVYLKVWEELKNNVELDLFSFFKTYDDWIFFLKKIAVTKKHSQRALVDKLPSPAQLTSPDDTCHYSVWENRVLTVREVARIQSFPDWFIFKSKETTGGKKRSFEIPQYTQVGNAVPPKLAYYLGKHITNILDKINM